MGIHADFAAFVEENGEIVEGITTWWGHKVMYRYKSYIIMLDLGKSPEQEESRIVAVMKDGKFVYVSKFVVAGSAMLWNFTPDPKLANPEILSGLVEEWKNVE